jgi:hypothetical protein
MEVGISYYDVLAVNRQRELSFAHFSVENQFGLDELFFFMRLLRKSSQ